MKPILERLKRSTIESLPDTKDDGLLPLTPADKEDKPDVFDFSAIRDLLDGVKLAPSGVETAGGGNPFVDGVTVENPLITQILEQFETAVNAYGVKVRSKAVSRRQKRLRALNQKKLGRGFAYNDKMSQRVRVNPGSSSIDIVP